jgi:hypothetical protein
LAYKNEDGLEKLKEKVNNENIVHYWGAGVKILLITFWGFESPYIASKNVG